MSLVQNWLCQKFGERPTVKGMGTVEVILIIVVLVGLVVLFKGQITGIVTDFLGRISNGASGI